MNAVERYELRAAEYRARAEEDARKGEASPLQSVREKYQRAARTWAELADAEELRAAQSKVFRGKPPVTAAADVLPFQRVPQDS